MLKNSGRPWTEKLQALKAKAHGRLSIAVQCLVVSNQSEALGPSKSSASLVATLTNSKVAGVVVVISSIMKEIPTAPW
jgi:hypothetical protein